MARTYPLELAAAGGAILPASAHISDRDWREFTVRVAWAGGEAAGTDVDAFCALRRVREALNAAGQMPRCYGACRNFVMSPMASQMGGGLAGHLVELGRPAGGAMVMTFEAGPDIDLAAVTEQQAFTRAWFDSLGLRPTPPQPAGRPKGLLDWVRSLWRRAEAASRSPADQRTPGTAATPGDRRGLCRRRRPHTNGCRWAFQ